MSHKDIGWENFTDQVISVISSIKEKVIFVLWGSHAQSKIPLIDNKHFIIKSPHPSPLSAHRGFLVVNLLAKLTLLQILNLIGNLSHLH